MKKLSLSPITEHNKNTGEDNHGARDSRTYRQGKEQCNPRSCESMSSEHDGVEDKSGAFRRGHRRSKSASGCGFSALSAGSPMLDLATSTYRLSHQDSASLVRRRLSLHSQYPGNVLKEQNRSSPPQHPQDYGWYSRGKPVRSRHEDDQSRISVATSRSMSPSVYGEDNGDILNYANGNRSRPTLNSTVFEPIQDSSEQKKQAEPSWCISADCLDSHSDPNNKNSSIWPVEAYSLSTQYPRMSQSDNSSKFPSHVDEMGSPRIKSTSREDVLKRDTLVFRPKMPQSLESTNDLAVPPQTSTGLDQLRLSAIVPILGNETPSRRALTSILQETSGNKSSPTKNSSERPLSSQSAHPFVWTELVPGKPSSKKCRTEGHKRQSRQRICFVPSRPSSLLCETAVEEIDEDNAAAPPKELLPGLFVTSPGQETVSQRPPSSATFDPGIPWPKTPVDSRRKKGKDYAPVLSFYNSYDIDVGRLGEDLSLTPTRKSSLNAKNNRRSMALNDAAATPSWPFANDSAPADLGLISKRESLSPSLDMSSQHFPLPPTAYPPPEWRLPRSRTIRGPRAPPARRSPTRRSPTRLSPVRKSAGTLRHTGLAVAQEIRKKNSEIWEADSKYYLNMPAPSVLPDTPESAALEGFELATPKRHGDQRATELGDSGRKMMEKAWREAHRSVELLGQGMEEEKSWVDEEVAPRRIYDQVNHINGGS
ncbi:hypothetical protein MMC13_004445 [Lambiella insularis]|nr:hypothetical protein [Lambiella insularis]